MQAAPHPAPRFRPPGPLGAQRSAGAPVAVAFFWMLHSALLGLRGLAS
jgi:hypothetical protein